MQAHSAPDLGPARRWLLEPRRTRRDLHRAQTRAILCSELPGETMFRSRRDQLVLSLVAIGILGCKTPPPPLPNRLEIVHTPRFSTDTANWPKARAGYPDALFVGSATWGDPCLDPKGSRIHLSGFDFMLRFNPPASLANVASAVVVQDIIHRNTRRRTSCSDPLTNDPPVRYLEYFKPPNNDAQWQWCGVETQDKPLDRQGRVGCFVLPGAVASIESGQNAQVFNKEYAGWAPAQRDAFDRDIVNNQFVMWLMNWQYDGCANPPVTPTKTVHWLLLRWAPVNSGTPGAPVDEGPWQGAGQAW